MGDARRFEHMAEFIAARFPVSRRIADVAGGTGQLQAELRRRGFQDIVTYDKRKKKCAGPGRNYHYGLFDYRSAARGYDLVIGMHPDGGTDHIIGYATKHKVPFVLCPCCIIPSAFPYSGPKEFKPWVNHLRGLAPGFAIETQWLHITGRNLVLVGKPN